MNIGLKVWTTVVTFALSLSSAGLVANAAEAQRPVAVFGGKNDVQVVIHSSLLPPDAAYDIPYKDGGAWLEPSEFSKYAAVVVCYLGRKDRWNDAQLKEAERYVQKGGHLILLSNAPSFLVRGREFKKLEPLLGAAAGDEVKEGGKILMPSDPLLKGVNPADCDWAFSGSALGKLTTARALAGTEEAATVSVNDYGKGQVVFVGEQIFRVMADRAQGLALRQVITNAILASNPTQNPSKREAWIPKPLGPHIEPAAAEAAPMRRQLTPTRKILPVSGQPVTLVRDGKAQAVIVTADQPSSAAREAAKVIQANLKRMSGAELPIIAEGKLKARRQGENLQADGAQAQSFILVGQSKLAAEYGIDSSKLPYEGYQIKTAGNVLLVAGRDSRENGLALTGTRHGAYTLLEQLGFRWLWPGDVGTVVPHNNTVAVAPTDFTDAPALRQRRLRNSVAGGAEKFSPAMAGGDEKTKTTGPVKLESPRFQAALDTMGFSAETYLKDYESSVDWFVEMGLGSSYELKYTHAYGKLYERFGKTHPEWFALQANGLRTQFPSRERLCVSNQGLIEQIAQDKIAELKADPLLDCASISPNDGGSHNFFCMCENCRKLDPTGGPLIRIMYAIGPVRQYVDYPSLSDRMVRFYTGIGDIVAKALPDRMVGAYAYSTYRSPPLEAKLAPNVLIGFVGLSYFNEPQRQTDLKRWDAWSRVAHQIFLRPNALLAANGLPAVFTHKLASDIKHCYQSGMIATDFDSIQHHWASRGLNTYVLAKLLWDPSRDVDAIIDDYCQKGFGPAAKPIRSYFDALEKLTDTMAASHAPAGEKDLRDEENDWAPVRGGFEAKFFTPEVTAHLGDLLEQARQASAGDKTILARIDFLAIGLRYAQFAHSLYDPTLLKQPEKGHQLMDQRLAFYKDIFHNHPYALNVAALTWDEGPYLVRAYKWKHPAK
jgi:hypothetical protein